MTANFDIEKEIASVKAVIEDNIKWPFPEKNRERLVDSLAHDDDLFIYHPDSKSTIKGWQAFRQMIDDIFMAEELKPLLTDIKNLKINLSRGGETAWFSCLLDDCGEYKGRKWEWLDCRWTGVLEKRDNSWVIVQMHFSLPTD